MNGLPSYNQSITSSIHRLIKMSYLYTNTAWDDKAEEYIKELQMLASKPLLKECHIKQMRITTAPKVSSGISMKFHGYIGILEWERDIEPFVALLQFSSKISIGNDVVYGMGQFEIKS